MGPLQNWAVAAVALALVYYVALSIPLAVGMAALSAACLWSIAHWPWVSPSVGVTAVVLFVLAWAAQFWGHSVEGKRPSFLKDLQFLLIGPAWLMHFIYRAIRLPY